MRHAARLAAGRTDLGLGDAAGGYGTVGLVDGVNLAVVPVVDRLCGVCM